MKRNFQIQFLTSRGLQSHHRLLDVGCGTLRGGIPIIDFLDQCNYTGIDVRQPVIDEALKEIKLEGLSNKKPELLAFKHFAQFDLEREFDFLLAFSVLFHMHDDIVRSCFDFVRRHLSSEGAFFANVDLNITKEETWLDFPVVAKDIQFYQNICEESGLRLKELGTLRSLGHPSGVDSQDNQIMLEIRK